MAIYLREADVEQLLTMRDALREVENALRAYGSGGAQNRPRQRVRTPNGVLNVMPAGWIERGYMGFKAYAVSPNGVHFHFHLFDSNTGEYLAILEADRLGQMRTGAASGVATKYLTRDDAHTLGLIGGGWQAESQLEAVCGVRDIQKVSIYSRDVAKRTAFASKMAERLKIAVVPVESAEEAAKSDIVTTVTTSSTPVLHGEWLQAGTHVNAAGSNWASKREVDSATLKRATAIFVDSVEDAQIESGDLIVPAFEAVIGWQQVQEVSALVAGQAKGRTSADAITFFKSNGIALEDVAVGAFVYERAKAKAMGMALPF